MEPTHVRVILDLDKTNDPELIAGANHVHDCITAATATFPSPSPLMSVFATQIQTLEAQQQPRATALGEACEKDSSPSVGMSSVSCFLAPRLEAINVRPRARAPRPHVRPPGLESLPAPPGVSLAYRV
jgi:hypothetical protein